MTLRQTFNILKSQNNQEKLNAFYQKYEFIFNMPAKTLTKEIVAILKKENKDLKAYPVYEVEGNLYELQSKVESEQLSKTITTSISVKDKNSTHKIVLKKNSTAKSFDELKFGDYEINIFDILLNDNFENAERIHFACWKAIVNNLKETFAIDDKETTI